MRDPQGYGWRRGTPRAAIALAAGLALCGSASAASAETLRPGFTETVVADSLDSPVSMAIAPDGRVFVCEQGGALRVIRRGALLPRPFVTVPTAANEEEGLLGVAFDPSFAHNGNVYVCYTALAPRRHNVIARYTASGDTARPGSARVLYEMSEHGNAQHVAGGLHFGRDGMLYASTGENADGAFAQSLRTTFGKILRLRRDGTIPTDNPFYAIAQGRYRAIWARGLRNPFGFDIDRVTGRMYINDVGGSAFEEVNEGVAGANYGWPIYEGAGVNPGFRFPVHTYTHEQGCAITGGAFYRPERGGFPREWVGRYFYAEYCRGEIRWIDPASPQAYQVFGRTRVPGPVDIRVGSDGDLFYLARGNTAVTGGAHTSWGTVVRVSPARDAGR
jgi:glucose/arabinose dehydrogenase